ncbi:MAG TPA: glycerol-3-phosphate 1-O-acyltransferase PlsY [Alphaproteobacteria bacterium]|nr:glycerol-3-phosphate 1-O-acyltransferase PlsY [Alphaproteobacteria bacterium]
MFVTSGAPNFDWLVAGAMAAGYLLGSIPFGLILSRIFGKGDIRQIGSGNIGATNVLRTGSKPLALATLILDGGKGAAAFLLVKHMGGPGLAILAGGCAFVGHIFPIWLKFNGGKGVATFLGLMLAAAWPVGLLACATWLAVAAIFRYSSLAALAAAALTPAYGYVFHDLWHVELASFCAILIFIRHRANIQRLLNQQEPRIGAER